MTRTIMARPELARGEGRMRESDPEFDLFVSENRAGSGAGAGPGVLPETPSVPRRLAYDPYPENDLRIIANPLLGLAGMTLLLWIFTRWLALPSVRLSLALTFSHWRGADPERTLGLDLLLLDLGQLTLLLGVLLGISWTFQYHCLDCGGTGRLSQWKRHECPAVLLRRQTGRHRRFRGLTPEIQAFLWIVGLLGCLVYLRSLGFF